ncbi:MAG: SpoIIE family protein phosphatase [Leptospiraceae bacterium]|nr:SpoIIE family protein phosphatase [Leptospiraceae bacterium]MCP5498286.1 SpoIIE family protein phosphatase [Leptospiraceae bacterium]
MEVILVVEDEEEIRENIAEMLEDEGYKILQAENGQLAWEMMQKETVDFVICDIMMPVMDGYELLNKIRAEKSTVTLPFLFLSAKSTREDVRKGMNLNADDYITKPFKKKELLESIKAKLLFGKDKERYLSERMEIIKNKLETKDFQKRFLQTILSLSPEAIFIFDDTLKDVIYYNQMFIELFQDELNHSFHDRILISQDIYLKLRLNEVATFFKNNESAMLHEYEIQYAGKDFTLKLIPLPIIEVPDTEQFLCVMYDISLRKKQEATIEQFCERVDYEMELARKTQEKLIEDKFPQSPHLKIYANCRSMEKIGGDFLSYKKINEHYINIFMGDVSGHGISSAMVSAMAIAIFKNLDLDPKEPAKCLQTIHSSVRPFVSEHFISSIFLHLDLEKKRLSYVSAGHPPFVKIRNGNLEVIRTEGDLLILHEKPRFIEKSIELQKGDKLIFFSDGYFESMNYQQEILGYEGFIQILSRYKNLSIEQLTESVFKELEVFSSGILTDDRTLLIIEAL